MTPSRTTQLFEVSAFLLLILPSLVLQLFVTTPGPVDFTVTAAVAIARDVALVGLVAYFLWRNDERPARIGWLHRRVGTEILLGVLLFVPLSLAAVALDMLLRDFGLSGARVSPTFLQPEGIGDLVLAATLVVVVAIAEETIFRGYLLLRLGAVTGSMTVAVLGSTLIFGLGHAYEGASGMVTVGMMGLVFALVYLWRKSIIAPVVMHFLQDFLAIVVVPALAAHG